MTRPKQQQQRHQHWENKPFNFSLHPLSQQNSSENGFEFIKRSDFGRNDESFNYCLETYPVRHIGGGYSRCSGCTKWYGIFLSALFLVFRLCVANSSDRIFQMFANSTRHAHVKIRMKCICLKRKRDLSFVCFGEDNVCHIMYLFLLLLVLLRPPETCSPLFRVAHDRDNIAT